MKKIFWLISKTRLQSSILFFYKTTLLVNQSGELSYLRRYLSCKSQKAIQISCNDIGKTKQFRLQQNLRSFLYAKSVWNGYSWVHTIDFLSMVKKGIITWRIKRSHCRCPIKKEKEEKQAFRSATLLRRDSNTGVFLWILRNV